MADGALVARMDACGPDRDSRGRRNLFHQFVQRDSVFAGGCCPLSVSGNGGSRDQEAVVCRRSLFLASFDPSFAASAWTLEPETSRLTFEVTSCGAVRASFDASTADIVFDRNDCRRPKVHVVVDIVSVTTGAADRDQELS